MFGMWKIDLLGKCYLKSCDGSNSSITTTTKKITKIASQTKEIKKSNKEIIKMISTIKSSELPIRTTSLAAHKTSKTQQKECFDPKLSGKDYTGHVSVTQSGRTCQAWNMQMPHKHGFKTDNYLAGGVNSSKNYCR
jgi:hypothetical protein